MPDRAPRDVHRAELLAEIDRHYAEIARLEARLCLGETADALLAAANSIPSDTRGAEGAEDVGSSLPTSPRTAPARNALTSANAAAPSPRAGDRAGGRVGVAGRDSPPAAPAASSGATLALVEALVRNAGGTLALTPAEWADRLNIAAHSTVNPDLPGQRGLSFSRWFLNGISRLAWATAGLAVRRKTVHGRRLVEITLLSDDAEDAGDDAQLRTFNPWTAPLWGR